MNHLGANVVNYRVKSPTAYEKKTSKSIEPIFDLIETECHRYLFNRVVVPELSSQHEIPLSFDSRLPVHDLSSPHLVSLIFRLLGHFLGCPTLVLALLVLLWLLLCSPSVRWSIRFGHTSSNSMSCSHAIFSSLHHIRCGKWSLSSYVLLCIPFTVPTARNWSRGVSPWKTSVKILSRALSMSAWRCMNSRRRFTARRSISRMFWRISPMPRRKSEFMLQISEYCVIKRMFLHFVDRWRLLCKATVQATSLSWIGAAASHTHL